VSDYVRWLRERVGHDTVVFPGAAGLVRDETGNALLLQRRDNGLWGFPGGILEVGEDARTAVSREVREETGLRVEARRLIGLYTSPSFHITYPNGDEVQPFIAFFECEVVGGEPRPQASEVLELRWYDLTDPPELQPCCAAKAADAIAFTGETFIR
jgi:8-oxo-dGTP pyrophosphatase MutT (NUDIX family)